MIKEIWPPRTADRLSGHPVLSNKSENYGDEKRNIFM
jgi:hypothetical protein